MMFWLLPIIVFGPGTLAVVVLVAHYTREQRRDRRRGEEIAHERALIVQRAATAINDRRTNVVSIRQAPSMRREA